MKGSVTYNDMEIEESEDPGFRSDLAELKSDPSSVPVYKSDDNGTMQYAGNASQVGLGLSNAKAAAVGYAVGKNHAKRAKDPNSVSVNVWVAAGVAAAVVATGAAVIIGYSSSRGRREKSAQ